MDILLIYTGKDAGKRCSHEEWLPSYSFMLQIKKNNGNINWLISYQTYAYMLLNMQGSDFVIKELFLSSMSAIRAQAEV